MKATYLLAALLGLFLVSCEKETPATPLIPEESDYVGTVTVIYQDAPFDNENIRVNFTPSEDVHTASITLHQIRFVPQMPVTIDVTIPGINLQSTTEKVILTCERSIPWAMGGEYPRYTVTGLQGEIVGKELTFSLHFGDYPTSFKGQREP
jgi:hypothetical protein